LNLIFKKIKDLKIIKNQYRTLNQVKESMSRTRLEFKHRGWKKRGWEGRLY